MGRNSPPKRRAAKNNNTGTQQQVKPKNANANVSNDHDANVAKTSNDENSDKSTEVPNVPTQNSFNVLNNNQSIDTFNQECSNNATKDSVKMKIPPLFISKESIRFSDIHSAILAITKDYKMKEIKELYKVDIGNIESYRKVVKLLDNKNAQYHT